MSSAFIDLGNGFWSVRGSFRIGGFFDVGTQCSLVRLANGNFVFLLIKKKDGNYKVKKQSIKIGELSNEGFTVVSGVEENDLVATAGLRTLHSDMTVSLLK